MLKRKLVSRIISLTAATLMTAIASLEAKAALLVSSRDTGEVKAYDEQGNFIKNFITADSAGSGIPGNPDAFIIAPDGAFYLSSTLSGDILKYDGKTGDFIEFFADGGNPEVDDLVAPIDVVLSANGEKLYIANFASSQDLPVPSTNNDSILVYDIKTGDLLEKFLFSEGNEGPLGMALDTNDGKTLYVSTFADGVWRFDTETGVGEKFISEENFIPGDRGSIGAGIISKEDGTLTIADFSGNRILNFDSETGELLEVLVEDTMANGAITPTALKIGPLGELFVSGAFSSNVLTYDLETGDFLGTFVEANAGGLQGGNFGLGFAEIDDQPPSTVPEPSANVGVLFLGSLLIGSGLRKYTNQ